MAHECLFSIGMIERFNQEDTDTDTVDDWETAGIAGN